MAKRTKTAPECPEEDIFVLMVRDGAGGWKRADELEIRLWELRCLWQGAGYMEASPEAIAQVKADYEREMRAKASRSYRTATEQPGSLLDVAA